MERKRPFSLPKSADGRSVPHLGLEARPFLQPGQGTVDEEVHEGQRDVVEHDCRDDLVDSPHRLECRRDQCPQGAPNHGEDNDHRDVNDGRKMEVCPRYGTDHSADEVLALVADIEHPGAKSDDDRKPGKVVGNGDGEDRGELRGVADAELVDALERLAGVLSERHDDEGEDHSGGDEADERRALLEGVNAESCSMPRHWLSPPSYTVPPLP